MKKKRGFALLTKDQRKEMSSIGGKTAQKEGRAHRWDEDSGKQAGRKGGLNRWKWRQELDQEMAGV